MITTQATIKAEHTEQAEPATTSPAGQYPEQAEQVVSESAPVEESQPKKPLSKAQRMAISASMKITVQREEIRSFIQAIWAPGEVREIRVLNSPQKFGRPKTRSGFWTYDHALQETTVTTILNEDSRKPSGVYITLNPVDPDLLARKANRMDIAEDSTLTNDSDIVKRKFIVIDVDPIRKSKISASDEEKEAAAEVAISIRKYLSSLGWPRPLSCDSGNGWHLIYLTDLLNDEKDKLLVKNFLHSVGAKFTNEHAEVDLTMHNASRIIKLAGTTARKGDSTEKRPHRVATISRLPQPFELVARELIEQVAAEAPAPAQATAKAAAGMQPTRGGQAVTQSAGGRIYSSGDGDNIPGVIERATNYLGTVSTATEGQHGSDQTYKAAGILVRGFALSVQTALGILSGDWNSRCSPPWDERDLLKKLNDALEKGSQVFGALIGEPKSAKGSKGPKRDNSNFLKAKASLAESGTITITKPRESGSNEKTSVQVDCDENEDGDIYYIQTQEHEIVNALIKVTIKKNGEEREEAEPINLESVLSRITKQTSEWPRRIVSALFVDDPKHGICWLNSPAALFGWVSIASKQVVKWHRLVGCVSKEEVYHELRRTAISYNTVEDWPHEPPLPNTYYSQRELPDRTGEAIKNLLARFEPETELDRELMLAAMLSPIWGGHGGSRPVFVISTNDGPGSGKTAFAKMLGEIYGGSMDFTRGEDISKIKTRLLTPSARTKRICLIDNIKTDKFSWSDLEALVTASEVSGHGMFIGESSRPNTLTWIFTLNGGNFSTDLSQRSIFIMVRKATFSKTWEDETREFIQKNRLQIIADLLWILRGERKELKKSTRWGAWERAVLSVLPHCNEAQALIIERQAGADAEQEEFDAVEDYFRSQLKFHTYDTDHDKIFIPSRVAWDWFNKATGERLQHTAASRKIRLIISQKRFKCIQDCVSKTHGRGFLWVGENHGNTVVKGDLGNTVVKGDLGKRMQDRIEYEANLQRMVVVEQKNEFESSEFR